jgi:hypothetical protein
MFKSFLSRLGAFFKGQFTNLFNVLVPIVKGHAGQLIDQLLPIALGIVTQMAADNTMPSAQKRDAAAAAIKAAAISQGYATASDLATSTVNFLVELAVQHLNATSPSPAA